MSTAPDSKNSTIASSNPAAAVNAAPPPLNFTDAAAYKVKALMDEEADADLNLRVFVQGGGCSGFQYGFMFDKEINEDDEVIAKSLEADTATAGVSVVQLLIDSVSLQYLKGAEIDYREDLNGAQFVIRNPNAKNYLRVWVFFCGG